MCVAWLLNLNICICLENFNCSRRGNLVFTFVRVPPFPVARFSFRLQEKDFLLLLLIKYTLLLATPPFDVGQSDSQSVSRSAVKLLSSFVRRSVRVITEQIVLIDNRSIDPIRPSIVPSSFRASRKISADSDQQQQQQQQQSTLFSSS